MIDRQAQQERRRKLVNQARSKNWTFSNGLFAIGLLGLISLFGAGALYVVMWVVNSSSHTPSYARENTSFWWPFGLCFIGLAVFAYFKTLQDDEVLASYANADADKLDAAEEYQHSVLVYEEKQRREAIEREREAERQRQISVRQWEVERIAREKAERLAELEGKAVVGWSAYRVQHDFLGDADPAQLRAEYKKEMRRHFSVDDLRVLDATQNPALKAIKGVGFLY